LVSGYNQKLVRPYVLIVKLSKTRNLSFDSRSLKLHPDNEWSLSVLRKNRRSVVMGFNVWPKTSDSRILPFQQSPSGIIRVLHEADEVETGNATSWPVGVLATVLVHRVRIASWGFA
jgi:hypothetical protein